METNLPQHDEDLIECHGVKRKRDSRVPSNDECSDTEPLPSTSKQFLSDSVVNTEDIAQEMGTCAQKSVEKSAIRKRKFLFSDDAPSKFRKFYFLNQQVPKPRKPKLVKSPEKDDEKLEFTSVGKKHKLHFAKADSNGNVFLMHRLHSKFDLFFNDEKKYNYEAFKKLDLAFHIVDEIALEGLDGITVEAFWKRLKNVFPNNINKSMADRIWRIICNNKRINFYILKEGREELVSFDRCKYLDIDSGIFVEPFIEFKDIYPMVTVNGTEIRGSCSTFDTRKENNGVRKFSMDKALKLYDQKLVFVADQTLRNKALINEEADPNIELLDVEYCMLERIGRSREQGELTQGKMSLVSDTKKLYHNRKALAQHCLIVPQSFCLKSLPMQQTISGGLVQLSRFYHKRKTKQIAIMERIAQILKMRPNFQMEFTEFRKIFGRNFCIVKLVKSPEFRRFFKLFNVPFRKLYPHATKQEYLHKNKRVERQLKILRMVDPCANVTVLMDGKDVKENAREKTGSSTGKKLINYEYMRDIFLYILSSGPTGVTIQEIHEYFKTDFYSVRMAVRKLLLRNVIIASSKIDMGRQQSLKFFAKCFSIPDCHINTKPKVYELSEETTSRVLKGYNAQDLSGEYSSKPPTPPQTTPVLIQFTLKFEPFCCTSFVTETVDAYSEELTIYDIVNKGRDKLLLIGSNLFAHYVSEWDGFLLKREDFSKDIQLFQYGFGKIVYDFLKTIRIDAGLQTDDHIIFSIDNITPETKIVRQFNPHRVVSIVRNYNNPHSDSRYIDTMAKVYLFEAMFNEFRKNDRCLQHLKDIFERIMISDGKKKRNDDDVNTRDIKLEVEVSSNVAMEKFMGADPVLEFSTQEEDITINIYASTKPENIMDFGAMFSTDDVNLSQRYMNRANLILKTVYEHKIIQEVHTLYKDVLKEEDEEGYDKRACKKSIVSIICKLVSEGYIKCYKVVMTGKNTMRTQCFICVHDINCHHTLIKSTIDQLKLKFYVGVPNTQKTITIKKKSQSPFNSNDVRQSITELKQLTTFKTEVNLKSDRNKGRSYGYVPKFERMRVLHELLFFVIREIRESEPLNHRHIFELCKGLKIRVSQSEITEMPPVYRNEVGWRMFIPPLLKRNWPTGWALACDIVLRMPLSILVKLYNLTYEVPELETYLNHPLKKHYLVKSLPVEIRNLLFYRRKYFHSIYETICNLCYIGLVQLGPRSFKEKDQLFLFVNSKATLYDTCSSRPGYNVIEDKKYKKIPIEFKSGSDVEIYWSEMLRICLNTPLGKRKILAGQYVTIEECASKPAMSATLRAKGFEEAVKNDNGKTPGDHKGSAGFDSSLWSFVKRNWVWSSQLDNKTTQPQPVVKNEVFDIEIPKPIQYDLIAKGGPPECKVYLKKKTKKSPKLRTLQKLSRKKFVRKIVASRKRKVREYFDALDRSIMKKNDGMRVDWSEEEDQLLRYTRIASLFLCPIFKKQFIPYNILRDVLHRIHPRSKNKTARAIQRRIYVLITNDETLKIMETNIENLLNSEVIGKYFAQIRTRYKNSVKLSDSHIQIAFVYLMSYIYRHKKEVELLLLGYFTSFDFFSDANIAEFQALVENCDHTNSAIYTNPKSVEDISKDTIKSIIHCSMACRKNSVGWTYHLSRICKKFQDTVIRSTVNLLRKDQFFVHNKNSETKNVDKAWPVPIKFSCMYNQMKTTSYTTDMFREAFRNFSSAIANTKCDITFIDCNELNSYWDKNYFVFDVPEMGIILNPAIEDHSEVIEELASRFNEYLHQIYQKNSGTKTTVETPDTRPADKDILAIKEEVKNLIFRVPYLYEDNLELYFKKMMDSNTSLEINNYVFLMIVDLNKFAQSFITIPELKKFIDGVEDDAEIDDQRKLVRNLSKVVFAIQSMNQIKSDGSSASEVSYDDAFQSWEVEVWVAIRNVGDEESVGTSHKMLFTKNYPSGMEECIKKAQEGVFPSLEEIKEGIVAEVDTENRTIPHITDLIMLLNEDRFPDLDTDIETIEKMKEHFVMQYPQVEEFTIEEVDELKEEEVTRKILDQSKSDQIKKMTEKVFTQPELENLVRFIRDNNGSEDDIKRTETLIDFIKERRETGVTAMELKTTFYDQFTLDLVQLMGFLTKANIVIRTGISSIVYVHYEYRSEWLTETFVLTPTEKEIFESKQKNFKSLLGDIQSSEPRNVQLKPWTKLDGTINDEVFQEWLCIVLSKCIDFPNIPLMVLCEQLHYMKPVDVYFLLEVLQELGCFKIYLLKAVENILFSTRCVVDECEATCLDNFEDMFVKPTNVAGLCFGSFLEKDF